MKYKLILWDILSLDFQQHAHSKKVKNYVLNYRDNNRAIKQLIKQHMMNENMTINHLINLAQHKSM